ncbi:hypothetical protein [Paenibacillus gallinarum]|uniref:Uncharacterized protein n=1 Tax=Paenibacillus gallinarum TaxID=2762232 RepID=A0ABR8T161_9BACL|nr:hypothetical protein [Paenibacillus gallinarum]MBD7969298.1 hypothetical protein [Paenibacillus gallinarum]
MIEIQALIERTGRQIEKKFCVSDWLMHINSEPESRYVNIDDRLDMSELINNNDFSGKHLQLLFLIKHNQEYILGYNVPSGYNLWSDFLNAAEDFANYGRSKRSYGVDPLIMEIRSVGKEELNFSIYYEMDRSKKYIDVMLPTQEFMISLASSLRDFLVKMIHEYKVDIGDEGTIIRVENLIKKYDR